MKLSIITINYNNRAGLQDTIDSVVNQTWRDFEWIIVDGGSTDGSKELIEQYQDHFSYWCSEPDKGIYNAMNKGVGHAKGEYCLFLNSGDCLCNSTIIEKLEMIHFYADIVSCDMYVDGYNKTKLRKSVDRVNAYWLYDNSLFHPSTWIRREVLIKNPYYEEYKTISDWIFFFESLVILQCTYQHIPIAITVFYKDGISNQSDFHNNAFKDKYSYLKNYYPARYVDEKETPQSLHYITANTLRMTRFGQMLMKFLYKIVASADIRLFKPFSHFLNYFGK